MEASTDFPKVTSGEGYAVGHLDDLGDGPGFRKVRKGLGVTAFGVNAIVLPAGIETGSHYHDEQEELYFVHRGTIEMEFGDGSVQTLGEGCLARVDAATVRKLRNVGETDAVYLIAGGKDGYVGRDGRVPEGEEQRVRAIHDLSARAAGLAVPTVSEAERRDAGCCTFDGRLALPLSEITLRASRSSGPGGQHANVTASRVEAIFDVASLLIAERVPSASACSPGWAPGSWPSRRTSARRARNRELALARLGRATVRTPWPCPAAGARPGRRRPLASAAWTPSARASQRKLARRPPREALTSSAAP